MLRIECVSKRKVYIAKSAQIKWNPDKVWLLAFGKGNSENLSKTFIEEIGGYFCKVITWQKYDTFSDAAALRWEKTAPMDDTSVTPPNRSSWISRSMFNSADLSSPESFLCILDNKGCSLANGSRCSQHAKFHMRASQDHKILPIPSWRSSLEQVDWVPFY